MADTPQGLAEITEQCPTGPTRGCPGVARVPASLTNTERSGGTIYRARFFTLRHGLLPRSPQCAAFGASGRDLVAAIAVGLEVCVRIGMAGYDRAANNSLFFEHGQHATSICGTIGSAAAAAMLLGSEWPGTVPLIDPLCGSGTIPIEGALIARRIAPGVNRRFAVQRWPDFDASIWERLLMEAREQEASRSPVPIRGSDRDAGAIEAALANAERAGVGADLELDRRPLSAIEAPGASGWMVTNPPYGVRVADPGAVRDLYAALGKVLRARFAGWRLALLSPGEALERQLGLSLRERFATLNGGIPVRLVTGQVES
jgi:hypothetical protein